MAFSPEYISYASTNSFSSIVYDYVAEAESLRPFYEHAVTVAGVQSAIQSRRKFSTDRKLLVDTLTEQYSTIIASEKVTANIALLLNESTFTICTAHQPNIFTGHLYFIYKILHTVKLAEEMKAAMPENDFVPVYYMGSEDADLEELGEVNISGKKYQWKTDQTGAVGRMKIDKAFIQLVADIDGQLLVEQFGKEIMETVRAVYTIGKTIEQATFEFVDYLFADYGVVTLLPDNAVLKNAFAPVITKELNENFSHAAVQETINQIPEKYKVQAAGRAINLFYLKDNIRERIEAKGDGFVVANTEIEFSKEALFAELNSHPQRFSPNVILRPVFQEMFLPNIAFIGGGGELAYWLELKAVFEKVNVPFPVLILRNSFLIVPAKTQELLSSKQLTATDFFEDADEIIKAIVIKESDLKLSLDDERLQLTRLYQTVEIAAVSVDSTLQQHVQALHTQAQKKLAVLEKKMLKAERKKFEATERQVTKIKAALFPNGNLQERVDNILPYYGKYGKAFIAELYQYSTGLKQEFCILSAGPEA